MANELKVTPLRPGQGVLVLFAIVAVVVALEYSPRFGGLLLLVVVLGMLAKVPRNLLYRGG
jgi:hypothetical protein